jgi:ribosomal protein L37AE/L43A
MGDEKCVNGGWIHPQCTQDIFNLTKEEIDKIEVWYCQDCKYKLAEERQRETAPTSLKVVIEQGTQEN